MDSGYAEMMHEVDVIEYRINKHYRQAEKELQEKINKFYKDFDRLDQKKRELVNSGKMTEAEYKTWRQNKIMAGKVWEQRKDVISRDLYNANYKARNMVYDELPDVYASAHNFATYQIENGAHIDTSYTLYNREAVERLIADNPDMIPYQEINKAKDISWNKKNLQAVMIQGVLQGESIPHLAKRLSKTVVQKNRACAIRNARTMATSVYNSGKMDAFKRAEALGVDLKVRWRATFDDRTRDSHRRLDGEEVQVGQPFSNGLTFPCDMDWLRAARYGISKSEKVINIFKEKCAETYNCRCTIQGVVKGLEPRAIKYRSNKAVGIPYEEWKKGHKAANEYRKANGMLEHDRKGKKIVPKGKIEEPKAPVKEKIKAPKAPVREFKTLSVEEYNKMVTMSLKSAKSADKKAIMKHKNPDGSNGGYVRTTNYRLINTSLRKGHLENLTQYDMETVEALRRSIKGYSLPQDTTLFRYVHSDYGVSQIFNVQGDYGDILEWDIMYKKPADVQAIVDKINEQKGKEIIEKGFTSTSVIKEKNVVSHDKGVRMIINAPKGTNCFLPNNKIESECILGENTTLIFKEAHLLQEGNPKHNIIEMIVEVKE